MTINRDFAKRLAYFSGPVGDTLLLIVLLTVMMKKIKNSETDDEFEISRVNEW